MPSQMLLVCVVGRPECPAKALELFRVSGSRGLEVRGLGV